MINRKLSKNAWVSRYAGGTISRTPSNSALPTSHSWWVSLKIVFELCIFFVISVNPSKGGIRKYVFWCCVCGGLATILGSLFLAVYFLLRSYTSTLGYFETIPTFVPAAMVSCLFIVLYCFILQKKYLFLMQLILTGLCVISLARRKNRYSYLVNVTFVVNTTYFTVVHFRLKCVVYAV